MKNYNDVRTLLKLVSNRSELQLAREYGKIKICTGHDDENEHNLHIPMSNLDDYFKDELNGNENALKQLMTHLSDLDFKMFIKSLDDTCYIDNVHGLVKDFPFMREKK